MKKLQNYLFVILSLSGIFLIWECTQQDVPTIIDSEQEESHEFLLQKAAPTDGLVAYYPFNGNANDESGNNNHGTVYGASLTEDRFGNTNSAYSFDGLDDYIEMAHRAYLNINGPGFAVAVWIKAKPEQYSADKHYMFLEKAHGFGCLGYATGWVMQGRYDSPSPTGGVGWIYGDGSTYDNGVGVFNALLDDQWHLLIGVFDNTIINFYLDGVLEDSRTITGTPAHNEGVISVGRWWCGDNNGWPARFFNGIIDDIRIYDRALTEDEIISILNEGITITVIIDIKPGSYPNCFNNNGLGVIPVAILGSADFDVCLIDPASVEMEGMAIKIAGKSNKYLAHIEDINNDGFDDLVVQIEDVDGIFNEGTTIATVNGQLFDGTLFEGTDEICIVP